MGRTHAHGCVAMRGGAIDRRSQMLPRLFQLYSGARPAGKRDRACERVSAGIGGRALAKHFLRVCAARYESDGPWTRYGDVGACLSAPRRMPESERSVWPHPPVPACC